MKTLNVCIDCISWSNIHKYLFYHFVIFSIIDIDFFSYMNKISMILDYCFLDLLFNKEKKEGNCAVERINKIKFNHFNYCILGHLIF